MPVYNSVVEVCLPLHISPCVHLPIYFLYGPICARHSPTAVATSGADVGASTGAKERCASDEQERGERRDLAPTRTMRIAAVPGSGEWRWRRLVRLSRRLLWG